jgi:hypothetical protein
MKKKIHLVGYAKQHSRFLDQHYRQFRVRVILNGTELDPNRSQLLLQETSPGFAWGFLGTGPAHLALAICLELFGPDRATQIFNGFKEKHIACLPYGQDFEVEIDVSEYEPPPARDGFSLYRDSHSL